MASNLREFCMLAKTFDGSQNVAGWYASAKLDGCRCIWDGSITRGMSTLEIPWANTDRDGRYIQTPKATGLWSRYGKPIQAPDWFLDQLPDFPLDGELFAGHGRFQDVMSIIKQLEPDERWKDIQFQVFDCPSYREWLADGEIRLKNRYEKRFNDFVSWAIERARTRDNLFLRAGKTYDVVQECLRKHITVSENLQIIRQIQLPYNVLLAKSTALDLANAEYQDGGEGLIVRMERALWVPRRVSNMLKIKPYLDDEGVVMGYIWGAETELGSKLLGMMGSISISWKGKVFQLSGFTDEERYMQCTDAWSKMEGFDNPGKPVSPNHYNPQFPRGSRITFRYRELTNDGLPKEARFWRKA